MVDRREDILARLLEIAKGVRGIKNAYRNKDALSEDKRPAIVILDADETADEADPPGRPAHAPRRVNMNPEVYISLAGTPDEVGTELNGFRAAFLKAVFADATLKALTLDREGITYEASATGLARGRKMEGELGISLTFTYLFVPSEF